jgi:hypothetical protein
MVSRMNMVAAKADAKANPRKSVFIRGKVLI